MQTPAPDSLSTQAAASFDAWLPASLQAPWMQAAIGLALLALVSGTLHFVARRYFLYLVGVLVRRTRVAWDQVLFETRVPHRVSAVVPLLVVQAGIDWVPHLPPDAAEFLRRVAAAAMVLVIARSVDALLTGLHNIYLTTDAAATRPIKSYVQLAKIFVYLVAAVFIVARLADQTPWFFVSGLGAIMAIILLIFRDTLLSLVASVQLSNNDLIRVGDWIEMPQFGADGDVVDIALNTVKVQNWDRTVTVIPTHKFLEHSFRNWRNMFEGGGRRIKRSIHVNLSTIRFLDDEEIERFFRFALPKDYMAAKRRELAAHNAPFADDPETIVNARRLTNVGTLRAYMVAYLRSHPAVRDDMTFLVRQLEPTPEGLPLEVYVFASETRWAFYEAIQADVFDHVLAMVPEFGLKVYQRPAGGDFSAAALEEGIRPLRIVAERAGKGEAARVPD
jgi:miniconductance mechanosensitive channel